MSHAPELDKMTLDELLAHKKDVEKAIVRKQKEQKDEARARIEQIAADAGFSVQELMAFGASSKKPALPAKYQHPDDASKTWSGRGRQPAWFKEALEQGKTSEDLEIKS